MAIAVKIMVLNINFDKMLTKGIRQKKVWLEICSIFPKPFYIGKVGKRLYTATFE